MIKMKPDKGICPYCKKEFETYSWNKVYCCYRCRSTYYNIKVCKNTERLNKYDKKIWEEIQMKPITERVVICPYCEIKFRTTSATKKYCCYDHRIRLSNLMKKTYLGMLTDEEKVIRNRTLTE